MVGITKTVTVEDAEARAALEKLTRTMTNREGFYRNAGEHLMNSTADNFQKETGPDGQKWKPLLPATIERRAKRGLVPIEILRARGRLAGSINLTVTNDEARLGTPVPYAAAHQLGATIERKERRQTIYQHYDAKTDTLDQTFRKKSRSNFARDVTVKAHEIKIPARPYLGVKKEDEKILVEIAEDWLKSENPALK
ncbi:MULTISPECIES: phage virion morphogenesis protein [unclassified Ensifer]|uniref:phage virion morphogenesis protein n=1 Tax=unclassified Ensifer TaxID=2633371 RepID=UPI000812DB11|nr:MULTISPECIES: phage virion morphogenesis protein [unclassified Ensifer]OCP17382.1 phage virion morphogenesis protein [Ensifer sp. LC54]OCP28713.1 phage virion morphogenesis protein [Ensifer sp. LC384]